RVTITGVKASRADIVSTGGNILDGGDARTDVTATALRLQAKGHVGSIGAALDLAVGTVAASAAQGTIQLATTGNVTVGSVSVTVNTVGTTGSTKAAGSTALDSLRTQGGGAIDLRSGGSVVLAQSASGATVGTRG